MGDGFWWPIAVREWMPNDTAAIIAERRPNETDEEHWRRCGLIKNIAQPEKGPAIAINEDKPLGEGGER